MFRRISVAGMMALLIVLAVSGFHYDRSVYRFADGRPKDDFVDNFVNDSVMVGENYINGVSASMNNIYNIFGVVRKIPIIKDLVNIDGIEEEGKRDWTKVEIYELDYRKFTNRNKTDLDVLPPEEFVEVGDELIVKIICADYDVLDTYNVYRVFYRVWIYGLDGYYTDYKCYMSVFYKRDGLFGKTTRRVKRGTYLGMHFLGYVTSDELEWVQ